LNGDGVLDVVVAGADIQSSVSKTTQGVAPLLPFSLKSRADALQALPEFRKTITRLSQQRATIGAFQSRISFGTNVLESTVENYATAESRIRDVDIAEEAAKLTRLRILQQAATAVLGQANLQPSFALKLLEK
jgi:flagellin